MKRSLNLISVFGLLSGILFLAFSACKKDSSGGGELTGRWLASIPKSEQTSLYEFKADHTYEHTLTGTDSVTKKNLGIIAKEVGKYQLKDKQLNFYDIVSYLNKDYKYGPVTDLVVSTGLKSIDYTVLINAEGNKFSLSRICGPNELCATAYVPPFYYYKQ